MELDYEHKKIMPELLFMPEYEDFEAGVREAALVLTTLLERGMSYHMAAHVLTAAASMAIACHPDIEDENYVICAAGQEASMLVQMSYHALQCRPPEPEAEKIGDQLEPAAE